MSVAGPRVLSVVLLSTVALLSVPSAARCQVSDPPARFRAVDLQLPDADIIGVSALNSHGQIAAFTSSADGGSSTCWLYDSGALKPLGTLGGQTCVPFAMNDSGQIVGHSTTAEGYDHPFLYSDGRMTDILSGAASVQGSGVAWAINSSGAVVGQSTSASGTTHAFLYEGGVLSDIDQTALVSVAFGINNAGQITGWRRVPDGSATAYRYQNGVFEDITAPDAVSTIGRLINAAGDVAGAINTAAEQRAFLFGGGGVRDLGTLGGPNSSVSAMNDDGEIAGSASVSDVAFHAVVTRNGVLVDLGSLADAPNDFSAARSINASGHVVGWSMIAGGSTTAVFSTGAGLQNLNASLTADAPADITDAFWINDAGQIAATGVVGGRPHAYLLSPASIATALTAAPVTLQYGTHPQLSATLMSGSTPLAQKMVTFAIDDVAVGSALTDDNGLAELTVTGQTIATGDHIVSAAFAGDAEYASSSGDATLTVLKAHARLLVGGGPFTYDGQPHPATVSATGVLGETLTGGLLVSYSSGDLAPMGAGTYSANVQFSGDGNYEPDVASATITVLRAPLTVAAKDAKKLLGAANPAFAASYSGFVPGETSMILSGTLAFATAAASSSPVGTYAIRPSGLSSPNYDIRYADGTLTITYNLCIRFDQTRAARAGSTIPIKLDLCTAGGVGASSPSVVLNTDAVRKLSGTASTDVQDAGDANPDSDFRYLGPGYIFNLSTKGLTTGTWALDFSVTGDPLEHSVTFQVR